MLAGDPPFTGWSAGAILARQAAGPVPRLRTVRDTVPGWVEQAVTRALAKAPADRFPTAADFIAALIQPTTVTGAEPAAALVQPPAAANSIAVLPFLNMSADPDNEYFSDGMTEEIVHALSAVGSLRVASRTSSFAFKGATQNIRTIGEKLQVRTVLEGSVRRADTKLRVTAQLINAADGFHLWSATYEREMKDVFALQDEIARAIVSALKVKLTDEPGLVLVEPHTSKVGLRPLPQGALFLEEEVGKRDEERHRVFSAGDRNRPGLFAGLRGAGRLLYHAGVLQLPSPERRVPSCEGGCRRGNRDRRRSRRGAHRARVCEPPLRLGLAGCGATIPAGDRAQRELSDRAFLVCVLSVGRGTDRGQLRGSFARPGARTPVARGPRESGLGSVFRAKV